MKAAESEVAILRKLSHPNIIYVKDCFDSPASLYIVLEIVQGGEVFDKIVELKHYSEDIAARMVYNLCSTLQYMHSNRICHRDLKPENLMLKDKAAKNPIAENSDQHLFENILTNIKLVDFGFAIEFEPGKRELTECCGTPNFIAPEILSYGYFKDSNIGYNEKVDLWATGVLAYILLCGYPPFHATSQRALFKRIRDGVFVFHQNTAWDNISADAKDFIQKLLNVDVNERYSADQALKHQWLSDGGLTARNPAPLTNTQAELKKFNARKKMRGAIFSIQAAHRAIYLARCMEMNIKPNSGVVKILDTKEDDLTILDFNNNYLGVKGLTAALASIQESNTVHTLKLKNNQLDNNLSVTCVSVRSISTIFLLS